MADQNITLGMILEHMRGMEFRLTKQTNDMDKRLSVRMDSLDARMDRIHNNLSFQLDAIDKRLDEIEIGQLPKRVNAIEQRLGITV